MIQQTHHVYLHPNRAAETYLIYQLSDTQISSLLSFLQSSSTGIESPLPLRSSRGNVVRYDPYDSMDHQIFRDKWERKRPMVCPDRCRRREVDFP